MGRRLLVAIVLLAACAAPAPPPQSAPPATPSGVERKVFVIAKTLNVRAEPSTGASVLTQVNQGDQLTVMNEEKGWSNVRLANGATGWVSSDYISTTRKKTKPGCESEFAFRKTPLAAFSEGGPHGLVVVDATVNTTGDVVATKIISNSTGEDALAKMAEREIRSAKFTPPYRDCVPRSFIFTYKRAF
jgi:uncharacterized protein YgiM (DUF1202 family)